MCLQQDPLPVSEPLRWAPTPAPAERGGQLSPQPRPGSFQYPLKHRRGELRAR